MPDEGVGPLRKPAARLEEFLNTYRERLVAVRSRDALAARCDGGVGPDRPAGLRGTTCPP
ncbi:hypothetical protein OG897_29570 [Streptomyces sp. NBC_00237]|uniref:hypothetical protein n=1 Tax=Streptomyces sp. NBC_00237 TaxID=2975687 RepID=UPI002254C41B|nr:hypothetical protein [Streptomyces sp. NBC_00237]MCX5205597.1 hypothetical protein [Streptomyces sp. NBC_00237]